MAQGNTRLAALSDASDRNASRADSCIAARCSSTVFDGKRLNPRKADLRKWREEFALAMRDQGVDAEATPRPSRGIVKKPESQVIRHIERGDKTHQPRPSRVKALKELEVIKEIKAEIDGKPPVDRVWDAKIKKQQTLIRGAWMGAANEEGNPRPG